MVGLVMAAGRPEIVHRVDRDSFSPGSRQVSRHTRSNRVALLRNDRIDVRIDRIEPRRDKDARREGPLLMHVINDLRVPDILDFLDREPRFGLREYVPVAVVIVPGVMMINLRRRCSLIWRAERLVVPVLDDIDAIRIQRRYKQNYAIVENLFNLWRVT